MAEVRGAPLPLWYLDRPALPECGPFILQAFAELSTCRQLGFAVGPIPWRDLVAYGDRAGLSGDDLTLFMEVVRELDALYLARLEARKVEEEK